MFTKISHQYSYCANQTLEWLPTDTKELYISNLQENYDLLKSNNVIDKEITYKFNSHGFRCDEFTLDPSIMFLGCSYTCGIGLSLETNWTYLVSQQLNLKMINLGIGGTGADTAFRLANHYIPQLKPKIVVYLEPNNSRFSLISNKIHDLNPRAKIAQEFQPFYLHWMSNEENLVLHGEKHKLAIESLCTRNNAKYLSLKLREFCEIDFARDLMHRGIKSNEIFSKDVINRLEEPRGIEPRFSG